MNWWGWLLIGVGTALVLILIFWLVFRKKNKDRINRLALINSSSKRILEEKNAEIEKNNKLRNINQKLENELLGIAAREKEKLNVLDAKTAKKYRELSDNPDTLIARVNAIIRGE